MLGVSPWTSDVPIHERRFPRRWVLAVGGFAENFLGDEMHFNPDGSVESRSCLLLLSHSPDTIWRWELALDRTYVSLCSGSASFIFRLRRSVDAGFVLWGDDGVVLCSREKTAEEHLYRRYSLLHFPAGLRMVLEDLAAGRKATPYNFPPTLTSFERLAAHRLSDELRLQHDSVGIGLNRHIVVWRDED